MNALVHTSLSPCVADRLNLAWAVSEVKQICKLLVEKVIWLFLKFVIKIHFLLHCAFEDVLPEKI